MKNRLWKLFILSTCAFIIVEPKIKANEEWVLSEDVNLFCPRRNLCYSADQYAAFDIDNDGKNELLAYGVDEDDDIYHWRIIDDNMLVLAEYSIGDIGNAGHALEIIGSNCLHQSDWQGLAGYDAQRDEYVFYENGVNCELKYKYYKQRDFFDGLSDGGYIEKVINNEYTLNDKKISNEEAEQIIAQFEEKQVTSLGEYNQYTEYINYSGENRFIFSNSNETANSYLISYSDSQYLSEQDVQDFSVQELNYAKNEIFARHGRMFKSQELTEYFNSQPWYSGTIAPEEFPDSALNEVESANAEFLRSLEFSRQTDGYQLDQPGYDISAVRTMRSVGTKLSETGLVSDEIMQSMRAGNIEYLGTWFYLDVDEDGVNENVSFLACGSQPYYQGMNHCVDCTIFVEEGRIDQKGDTIYCGLYGVSLDGEHIWLIVADDGPSDDPVCTFYSYENKTLKQVGKINDSINNISVTGDGLIYGRISCRIWDTALIDVCWRLGDDGLISMIPQEYYQMGHYGNDYHVTLTIPITIYEEKNEQSSEIVMQPQKIEVPYTDAEKWVYLKGEDGTAGWFCTESMDFTERMKVFQGLFIAD